MNDAEGGLYVVGVSDMMGDIYLIAARLVLALGGNRLLPHFVSRLLSQSWGAQRWACNEKHPGHDCTTAYSSHCHFALECSRTAVTASTRRRTRSVATNVMSSAPDCHRYSGASTSAAKATTASRMTIPPTHTSW